MRACWFSPIVTSVSCCRASMRYDVQAQTDGQQVLVTSRVSVAAVAAAAAVRQHHLDDDADAWCVHH